MKRFQKAVSIIVASAMTLSATSVNAFATSLVSASDVEAQAEMLSPVLQSSLSGEFDNAVVDVASSWIQLFSLDSTPYAYFVPLKGSEDEIIGYSVISDIDGNNTVLTTAEGEGAKMLANNIISANDSIGDDDVIAYEFPDAFFVGHDEDFAKINLYGGPVHVEDISVFETNTVDLLTSSTPSLSMAPSAPSSGPSRAISTVYGSLSSWDTGSFVPVSSGVYYGGYQGWLTDQGVSQFWADRSCGVTAAANALYYMSKKVSGKSALYTKPNITQTSFSQFQKEIYDYSLSPAIWGIPLLSTMKSKVESWASYKGVSLSGYLDSSAWNTTNVRNYISTGLNSDRPVLLLTWNSPVPDLEYHWVTVTRIYLDGTVKILTSNWAGKQEYDFSTWCNGSSMYKAVLYFN